MPVASLDVRKSCEVNAAYTSALPRALYVCRSVATAARVGSNDTTTQSCSASVPHRPVLRYTRRRVRRRAPTYLDTPDGVCRCQNPSGMSEESCVRAKL